MKNYPLLLLLIIVANLCNIKFCWKNIKECNKNLNENYIAYEEYLIDGVNAGYITEKEMNISLKRHSRYKYIKKQRSRIKI